MRRHPSGNRRPTGATVIPFPRGTINATATAETPNQEGNDND